MSFLVALQFLTSLPILRGFSPAQMKNATVWFPVVGLLIGLVLAGLNWLLLQILPASVVNALLIAALVLLTGAIHLDGFADTCDGAAGHRSVEERWQVMRDSRTGAFGVVGLVILLLVKYVSLNEIPADTMTVILIFMPAVSRWAMVYTIFTYKYVRPSGLGTAYKKATKWPQFVIATIITLGTAGALFPFVSALGFILIGGVWMVTALLAIYFKYKFSGLTGDTYGAINEVAEVTLLLITVMVATFAGRFS